MAMIFKLRSQHRGGMSKKYHYLFQFLKPLNNKTPPKNSVNFGIVAPFTKYLNIKKLDRATSL